MPGMIRWLNRLHTILKRTKIGSRSAVAALPSKIFPETTFLCAAGLISWVFARLTNGFRSAVALGFDVSD